MYANCVDFDFFLKFGKLSFARREVFRITLGASETVGSRSTVFPIGVFPAMGKRLIKRCQSSRYLSSQTCWPWQTVTVLGLVVGLIADLIELENEESRGALSRQGCLLASQ